MGERGGAREELKFGQSQVRVKDDKFEIKEEEEEGAGKEAEQEKKRGGGWGKSDSNGNKAISDGRRNY